MNYREIVYTAWKSILSNKLRSVLTMLGVIIGVAAVIMMIAIGAGTEATISEQINGLGSNLIFINESFNRGGPGEGPTNQKGGLKYTDVAAIRDQIKGIAGVSVEQSASSLTAQFNDVTLEDLSLVGTTPDFLTVREIEVGSGRFFTDEEVTKASKVVVLGNTVAETLFPDGDPLGQVISVDNVNLTVIGVLAPKGLVSGTDYDAQIYGPIQLVFKKFTPSMFARIVGDRVRMINVSVEDSDNMQNVIDKITILLANRHKVEADALDFNIRTQSDIIATAESTTESFRTLLAVLPCVINRWRYRDYEHHAGQCNRAYPRNRSAPGYWGNPPRYPGSIPVRSSDAQPFWWNSRRHCRSGRIISLRCNRRYAHCGSPVFSTSVLPVFSPGWHLLRVRSCEKCGRT